MRKDYTMHVMLPVGTKIHANPLTLKNDKTIIIIFVNNKKSR
jgi:hypothetical protein